MLPNTYVFTWPIRIARWILLYFVFRSAGIATAALFAAIPFALQIVSPVPHRYFIPKLRRTLMDNAGLNDAQTTMALLATVRAKDEGVNKETA
jgi:hypothetical protein